MFRVSLPIYEGSVEDLLLLVKKRRLSPLEFEIASITKSYLSYLKEKDELELGSTSSSLVFLSELLLIKSLACFPKPEVIEEERDNLITYEKEYKEYKDVGIWIEKRIREQETRLPINLKQNKIIEKEIEISPLELLFSLKELLGKNKEAPIYELIIDEPRLEDAIEAIKKTLAEIKKIEIKRLFEVKTPLEQIVIFLAVLELIRQRFLKAIQHRAFSSIWLIKN